MTKLFEELDYRETQLGELILRRRWHLGLKRDVFEVILNEEHLMSSLFTVSEEALGRMGMRAALAARVDTPEAGHGQQDVQSSLGSEQQLQGFNVIVGGLGLGYTAAALLEFPELQSLGVVEYLAPVIEWHTAALLPLSEQLNKDSRVHYIEADFFAAAASDEGFDPAKPGMRYDAILLDIDHTPTQRLSPSHESLYCKNGLEALQRHLVRRGVFGLWSNEAADATFLELLSSCFSHAWAEAVVFHNPLQNRDSEQCVYLAVSGD